MGGSQWRSEDLSPGASALTQSSWGQHRAPCKMGALDYVVSGGTSGSAILFFFFLREWLLKDKQLVFFKKIN